MTKTDYETVGRSLSSMPIGMRIAAYKRLVRSLSVRNPEFDPFKFGASMGLPPMFRTRKR